MRMGLQAAPGLLWRILRIKGTLEVTSIDDEREDMMGNKERSIERLNTHLG